MIPVVFFLNQNNYMKGGQSQQAGARYETFEFGGLFIVTRSDRINPTRIVKAEILTTLPDSLSHQNVAPQWKISTCLQ